MSPRYQMASPETPTITVPPARVIHPQRSRRRGLIVAGVGVVLLLMVRGLLVQAFYIPSSSMEPTLEPGDRILVNKVAVASTVKRGDLVVFDGTRTFAPHAAASSDQPSATDTVLGAMASMLSIQTDQSDYVKRVVGLPGDHVVCCDAKGLITVNDVAVHEQYLYPGDVPSDLTFDVTVPSERVWLMGDHRSDSSDSRAHLGDPGGGMVRLNDVIGRAVAVYWPPSRASILRAPASLDRIHANVTGASHT
ncbi:MAG TPA: signal peptidase I [Dermatophilaceae bacterium]|nr:signal peptidase I [Dermatophilaceae bacterium]